MAVQFTKNTVFSAPESSAVATSAAGAVTITAESGIITTEALTTAGLATYTLTVTNTKVAAADTVYAVLNTYAGAGTPVVQSVATSANTITIKVYNAHATVALNAATTISFVVFKKITA